MRNQKPALNSNQPEQFPVIHVTISASMIFILRDEKYFVNANLGQKPTLSSSKQQSVLLLAELPTSIPLICLIIVKAIFSDPIISWHTWDLVGIVCRDPSGCNKGRLRISLLWWLSVLELHLSAPAAPIFTSWTAGSPLSSGNKVSRLN